MTGGCPAFAVTALFNARRRFASSTDDRSAPCSLMVEPCGHVADPIGRVADLLVWVGGTRVRQDAPGFDP